EIEEQWAGSSRPATRACTANARHERSVRTLGRCWTEPRPGAGRRGVVQETKDRIKDIAPGEEPAEHLRIVAVQPIPSELDGMLARKDGEVVSHLNAFKHLVNLRFEEEGSAKAEGGSESHGSIGGHIGCDCRARPVFARKAEMAFIHLFRRYRGEHVEV